jgi:hypothetical protein
MDSVSDPIEPTLSTEKKLEKKREFSSEYQDFESKLLTLSTPEEKIQLGLDFMKSSISQEGSAKFFEFWEASKKVVSFFKDHVNQAIRSKLWSDYKEITQEARRLKDTLEEQSAFVVEQLEQAISYMEADLEKYDQFLAQAPEFILPENSKVLAESKFSFADVQRELNLLNALATRLNGLRKEVVQTEMRMRFKTKFFRRLSVLGDKIFPRKKTLMDEVSIGFEKEVDEFIEEYFSGDQITAPYFALRDEIKTLQSFAKDLTLTSGVFNRTRIKLSECWDKIKLLEGDRRKEVEAKKLLSSENKQTIEKRIDEISQQSLPVNELDQAINQLLKEMREVELQRLDVIYLKDKIQHLRDPHLAAEIERAKAQEEAEKEKARVKKEKFLQLQEKIQQVASQESSPQDLESQLQAFKDEIKSLGLSKLESQQIEKVLRKLKDKIQEAKEAAVLSLGEDDRNVLFSLKDLVEEKRKLRQEIKNHIDMHKADLAAAGLDIRKVKDLRVLIEEEKNQLEQVNLKIEELEARINEFKG